MIRYSCKDMGLKCNFFVKGENIEEVTKQALAHIRENHSEDFKPIVSDTQIAEMQKTLARSTRLVA